MQLRGAARSVHAESRSAEGAKPESPPAFRTREHQVFDFINRDLGRATTTRSPRASPPRPFVSSRELRFRLPENQR